MSRAAKQPSAAAGTRVFRTAAGEAARVSSLLALCMICSCRGVHPEIDTRQTEALPSAFRTTEGESVGVGTTNLWWTTFASEELNRLITLAFAENLTIAQAAARLRQACAEARKAGAGVYPTLSAQIEGTVSQRHTSGPDAAGSGVSEAYSLSLAASYEVDFWGRVGAGARRAEISSKASRLDIETAAMTVAAQVADRWLQLVEANAQVNLIRSQIETNTKAFDLLKTRLGRSSTRLLDVYQQEQTVRASEAALPPAEQRVDVLRNELAVLIGVPPGSEPRIEASPLPVLPPQPDTGIPSDLIARRPDIRSELLRLHATGWDIVAARADRLPALRLTASAGTEAGSISALFDDWFANLAAGLIAPLLDGGRRRAEEDRVRARADEQLARYRQVILEAVREVQDALIRERRIAERLLALEREIASSRQAMEEAQRRYLGGATDYLTVLTALRSVQQSERDALVARRELLTNRVTLWRALGGSWATEAAAAAARADRAGETPDGTTTRKATP